MDVREAQAEIYGEPLRDILARCGQVLGLNQSRVAQALGVSAPMLSQLVNARRVKIGNPVAAQRLQVMHESAEAVVRGELTPAEALTRVEDVSGGGEILTTRRTSRADDAGRIQAMFRAVASAPQHLEAADAIATTHPEIAEMLRVYGAGRSDEAAQHLGRGSARP